MLYQQTTSIIWRQIDTICAQIQTTENEISVASLDKAEDYAEFFSGERYPKLKDLTMESRKRALRDYGVKIPHKLRAFIFRDQDVQRFGNNNRDVHHPRF